jgi:AbrB family looped-hinge helix DNA binding protein
MWHSSSEMAKRQTIEVTVGPQGRLVVPAPLRRRLGIEAGDVLVARAQDDRLVLERRDAILARVRGRLAAVPDDVSMVDELIAERREEAEREGRP